MNEKLHKACSYNEVTEALELLKNAIDPHYCDEYGETALHLASSAQLIEALLEAGFELEAENNDGETALQIMARRGATEAVTTLLANNAKYPSKEYGAEAPYMAMQADNPFGVLNAFKLANYDFAGTDGTTTPLHYYLATFKTDYSVLHWLLKNGANPYYKNEKGQNVLEYIDFLLSTPEQSLQVMFSCNYAVLNEEKKIILDYLAKQK